MLNQSKRWIEFTFSNLAVFESRDPLHLLLELLNTQYICLDRESTVFDIWFMRKSSWVFFKGWFEILLLCWIVDHKAINFTGSGFGFRRWTVLWIKVWPFQFGIPFACNWLPSVTFYFFTLKRIISCFSVKNKFLNGDSRSFRFNLALNDASTGYPSVQKATVQ